MASMVQSCIKPQHMIPCATTWLPESTNHLAVALQPEVKKSKNSRRRIWFPVDETGEPHPQNPDDGCGGAVHTLETVHIYETSLKHTRICENEKETMALFREAAEQLNSGFHTKEYIWSQFIKGWDNLPHPNYSYCGLLWRSLYGANPRDEEVDLEFNTVDPLMGSDEEEDDDWEKLKKWLYLL